MKRIMMCLNIWNVFEYIYIYIYIYIYTLQISYFHFFIYLTNRLISITIFHINYSQDLQTLPFSFQLNLHIISL
jgi:hypothetical protein